MEQPAAIFVYGTLKQGQLNCSLLEPFTHSVEPASTQGVLYDVGMFPALVDGTGTVRGEVVHLEPSEVQNCLKVLDGLEDYRPDAPALSTYIRRIINVTVSSGRDQRAFAYFYNSRQPNCFPIAALTPIDCGEWPGAGAYVPPVDSTLAEFRRHVGSYLDRTERM